MRCSLGSVLLEREGELGLLTDLLADVGSSGGKVVLIRGEAGIGKSSLVGGFLNSAADIAHIHIGYCDDLQTPQPLGPLWDVSRSEAVLRKALQSRDRQAVLESFFDLMTGSLRPTVVVIEDTQWSDEATRDVIKYVGRRMARANGLVLLTYRIGEVDRDHPLRGVIGDLPPQNVARIELGGLSRSGVAELVADTGLDPDRVLSATNGNPFLVTELASVGREEVPASVRDSVVSRIGKLSSTARDMLRVMSVIPDRISGEDIPGLTGGSDDDLAEGENLGLLERDGDLVSFRHELIRHAVESSLTISESVAIHRRLLDVLPDGTDPSRLVYHARGANDIDRLVVHAPEAALAAAEVGSHREAAAQFRALEPHLSLLEPHRRADILTRWALVEHYLERVESIEILDRAIELYREAGSVEDLARALVLAVEVNRTHGQSAVAREYALEAIRLLESGESKDRLAHALAAYSWLLIRLDQIEDPGPVADRAISVAEETGNELALISALGVKGTLAYVRGEPGGLDILEQLHQRARLGGYRYEEVLAQLRMAEVALELRDIERASDFSARAKSTAGGYELPILETQAILVHAEALLWAGAWSQADDLATETIGQYSSADARLAAVLGVIRTRTGRGDAIEYLNQAWSLANESGEIHHLLGSAAAIAERMWVVDTPDGALFEQFRDLIDRGIRFEYPWPAGSLAVWMWKVGGLDEPPEGLPAPYRDLLSGRVDQSASFWGSRQIPYEKAIALMSGDVSQRLKSLDLLNTLGATAVAARVRKELRDEGVPTPRGRGQATRDHAAGLTARQAQVLQLVAEGLTNTEIADRLFVSPRTIEHHVSAILAKLDSSTRDEAVQRARDDALVES
jgi:DNA-binding CsgD family transcriptional regulator/tetratricopeptide (TPR) repeat protein